MPSAWRYGRFVAIDSITSATVMMRASSKISSPFNPLGYPVPSRRSWCWYATSATGQGKAIFFSMLYPLHAWDLMISNSASVSLVGLVRYSAGILILPMSCSNPAMRKPYWVSMSKPISRAMADASSPTLDSCPAVYGSRSSTICEMAVMVPSMVFSSLVEYSCTCSNADSSVLISRQIPTKQVADTLSTRRSSSWKYT